MSQSLKDEIIDLFLKTLKEKGLSENEQKIVTEAMSNKSKESIVNYLQDNMVDDDENN